MFSKTSNGTNKNKSKHSTLAFVVLGVIVPVMAFADYIDLSQPGKANLMNFVNNFSTVLNVVIPFVAGLGFFGFLIGVLKYVGAGGDEERLGKAKQLILYGLIGLLVMFSFWGLAKLLANTYLSLRV